MFLLTPHPIEFPSLKVSTSKARSKCLIPRSKFLTQSEGSKGPKAMNFDIESSLSNKLYEVIYMKIYEVI